jgi:ribosomal protein L16 Arg81 hydroxylase
MKNRNLHRILSPLPVSKFLTTYFNKKPLFIRGRPSKFGFLFKEEEFSKRLGEVKEIRAVFQNFRQAEIKPDAISDMLDAGATICITGMEKAHERLASVAKSIASEIGYSGVVDFRAYLSPPGAGFDLHYDARVATTLQIAGNKRWWYSETPAEPFPSDNSPHPNRLGAASRWPPPRHQSMKSILLRPGDLLCLPAGVWHKAEADADSSLALNMAFNYSYAGAFDFVAFALRRRLKSQPDWRRAFVAGAQNRDGSVDLADVREHLEKMRDAARLLGEDNLALLDAWKAWMGRWSA